MREGVGGGGHVNNGTDIVECKMWTCTCLLACKQATCLDVVIVMKMAVKPTLMSSSELMETLQ